MIYTFSKPYEFEGEKYEKIEFDLDGLKGSDIAAAKKMFTKGGNFAAVPAADSEFCVLLLAQVASKPIEFFNGLPAKDYCALAQEVSNFLLG